MEKSENRVLRFYSPKNISTLITLKILLSKYAEAHGIRVEYKKKYIIVHSTRPTNAITRGKLFESAMKLQLYEKDEIVHITARKTNRPFLYDRRVCWIAIVLVALFPMIFAGLSALVLSLLFIPLGVVIVYGQVLALEFSVRENYGEIVKYVKAIIETGEPPEEQVRWSR
jgi:hypothetical protein